MARVLMPLPSRDFDPTEAAVSACVLEDMGHRVVYATPDGAPGQADRLMLTGEGLDPWGVVRPLRGVKVLGLVLRADGVARAAYQRASQTEAFRRPMRWDEVRVSDFDGLVLPGGHRARGMRSYLESEVLQGLVAEAFEKALPVGAICHGVVLAARSQRGGRSVLHGRKTTALTWAFEQSASRLARVGRYWDAAYYRTYVEGPGEPSGHRGVQAEVTRALASEADFVDVPRSEPLFARKTSGLYRDRVDDERPAFVVRDGAYVSARWPGDTHTFARRLGEVLSGR